MVDAISEWFKSTFGDRPRKEPDPNRGLNALKALGFSEEDPEYKLFTGYLDAAKTYQPQPRRYGGADSRTGEWAHALGDIVGAGFRAYGGFSNPLAHVDRKLGEFDELNRKALEAARAMELGVVQSAVPVKLKRIEDERARERNRQAARDFMRALGVWNGPAPAAPGAAAAPGTAQPATSTAPAAGAPPASGAGAPAASGAPASPGPATGQPEIASSFGPIPEVRRRLTSEEARAYLDAGLAGIASSIANGSKTPADAMKQVDEVIKGALELDPGYQGRKEATKERAKGLEKADREQEEEVRNQAAGAREVLSVIQQIKGMLLRPNKSTGQPEVVPGANDAFGPLQGRGWWQSAASALPLGLDRWVANPELHTQLSTALRKLGVESVKMNMKGQGAISDAERQAAAEAMAATLTAKDPQTFLQTLADTEELARTKIEREEMLRQGGLDALRGYDQDRNVWLLGQGDGQPTGGEPAKPSAAKEPAEVKSAEEAVEKLNVGDVFVIDGKRYRVTQEMKDAWARQRGGSQ